MQPSDRPFRQIVLDTETTGLNADKPVYEGHGVIEIGAIELVHRKAGRRFHTYIQPRTPVSPGALAIHGITNKFLSDKPFFSEVAADFIDFISGAELIIHNAPFDLAFLNEELRRIAYLHPPTQTMLKLEDLCTVTDTLKLARKKFPGRRNSLDALCQRFGINHEHRNLHGGLLDSELLLDVYLAMTGGQISLNTDLNQPVRHQAQNLLDRSDLAQCPEEASPKFLHQGASLEHEHRPEAPDSLGPFSVIRATPQENEAHKAYLRYLKETYHCDPLWPQTPRIGKKSSDD